MARAGIYKSEVVRARSKLMADGEYPSIDAIRVELGNTGSKATIHRYLKEIEEEEGGAAGTRVAVSEAIQDLVERLAIRLNEEAEGRVAALQTQHAAQLTQHQDAAAVVKTEAQSTRLQLEQTQRTLAEEKATHAKTSESLRAKTLESTQLAQQVVDLQERIAAEERHRQSLEEKHQHAREALEHFRQSAKEQREQEHRKQEQQVQYLQAELRTVNEALTAKQLEAVKANQEGSRLLGDLSRAQSDLYQAQEEIRKLRPLTESLAFAQRRIEELGKILVEQEASSRHLVESNEKMKVRHDELLEGRQKLELELAASKAAASAQEQIVGSMLQRLSATLPEANPTLLMQPEIIISTEKKITKSSIETKT